MIRRRPGLVLMTTDTLGGIWSYPLDLAAGLAQAGTRTLLASMGPAPSGPQRAAAAAVPGLILEVSTFRLEWLPGAEDELRRAGNWLLQLEQRQAPDVIHLTGYAHAPLRWRAPTLVVAHSCVLSWWRAVHGGQLPSSWDAYAQAVARGLAAANLVVAPTAAHLRGIEALYGRRPGARVIHNGADAVLYRSEPKREVIFSAGRVWDEAKNVQALDAVAPRLAWPVVVAGDWRPPTGGGEPPSNLLCLNLLERAQVRDWLATAAIYASPARYEPFGLGALEAALSGCALVLGDIPTLRELWSDAALFVQPDDHEALLAALTDLVERPSLRESFGRAARARGLDYSLELMTRGYLEAYADLAAGRPLLDEPEAWPVAAAD
jgi:glycogen(starch) synthase